MFVGFISCSRRCPAPPLPIEKTNEMLLSYEYSFTKVSISPPQCCSRCCPIRCCDSIPFDVQFLRTAKRALRRALAEEQGSLSEDALATVNALTVVNPTLPNPSEDRDLWSGSFDLVTTLLQSSDGTNSLQAGSATIDVEEDSGRLNLLAQLTLLDSALPAELRLTGHVSVSGDAELTLTCESLAITAADEAEADKAEAMVATTAAAAGLTLERSADGSALAAVEPLPTVRLGQLYLDQDCHIVKAQSGGEPFVLYRR